jgi:AraC-like DNA-binding protein
MWSGTLRFGESWAIFRGKAADNNPHAHAAIQIALAGEGAVTVLSGDGEAHSGSAFVIRPLVEHSLVAEGPVSLLYVEPQAPLAFHIADLIGEADIAAIDAAAIAFEPGIDLDIWSVRLAALAQGSVAGVDMRLLHALNLLTDGPGTVAIADAALACDLSESRLRTLAREQLGLPISTWLIWRKLDRAARALREGDSLAGAAVMGGFADQAHFARTMRRMFGITPRTAQRATGDQDSRSVQD